MTPDFDPDRFRIATDAMVEHGFDDAAEWTRIQIAREVRRLSDRRDVVDRILFRWFDGRRVDSMPSLVAFPETSPKYAFFYHDVRTWLLEVPDLIRGLEIQIETDGASIDWAIWMRVTIDYRMLLESEILPHGRPIAPFLEGCYLRLVSHFSQAVSWV